MGLNISPSIWQSYRNTTVECLQSRKHCGAIMDDLLLFTASKRVLIAELLLWVHLVLLFCFPCNIIMYLYMIESIDYIYMILCF